MDTYIFYFLFFIVPSVAYFWIALLVVKVTVRVEIFREYLPKGVTQQEGILLHQATNLVYLIYLWTIIFMTIMHHTSFRTPLFVSVAGSFMTSMQRAFTSHNAETAKKQVRKTRNLWCAADWPECVCVKCTKNAFTAAHNDSMNYSDSMMSLRGGVV